MFLQRLSDHHCLGLVLIPENSRSIASGIAAAASSSGFHAMMPAAERSSTPLQMMNHQFFNVIEVNMFAEFTI
jgi:hypothetical protein